MEVRLSSQVSRTHSLWSGTHGSRLISALTGVGTRRWTPFFLLGQISGADNMGLGLLCQISLTNLEPSVRDTDDDGRYYPICYHSQPEIGAHRLRSYNKAVTECRATCDQVALDGHFAREAELLGRHCYDTNAIARILIYGLSVDQAANCWYRARNSSPCTH